LTDHDCGNDSGPPSEPPIIPLWPWCIAKIKSKLQQRKAEREKEKPQDRLSRRTTTATVVIAGAAIITAVISGLQYRTFQGQLTVMQTQVDIMAADQRPWVYITNAIIEEPGPKFTKDGMYVSLRFAYKNAGHTPAKFALTSNEAHVVNNAEYLKPSFKACEQRRKKPRETLIDGASIFPNQDGTSRTFATIAPQNVARLKFEPGTTIVITGCIDYLFPTGPDHHETRFFYELVRTGPNNAMLGIDPDNAPTGASAYGLAINPGIAGDAD
jgi:hypothetical protein